jgi:hypothetical protein
LKRRGGPATAAGCAPSKSPTPTPERPTLPRRLHLVQRGGPQRHRRAPARPRQGRSGLGKVQRGLGGRYYKTRKQVDAKVARILGPKRAACCTSPPAP